MGNVVDKVANHKTETLLFLGIAAALCAFFREAKEKKQIKQLLKATLQSKSIGSKDFSNELNQVYLKEQVEHHSIRNLAENPIYKIAITGGPCGGKSTSLKKIQQDLTAKGFRVFLVPQIPTLVVHAGGMILMSKFNIQERIKFQSLLIRFQMYAEDYFTRLAEMSKSPAIVLCDRGTVDPAAYVSKEQFQAILDEQGWSWVSLRDRRYDRVIFMVTAANGAEKSYTLENNVARSQGMQLARELDKKTLNAWTGHPHLTICPNVEGESFDQKIDRAIRSVHKTVGLQLTNNHYQKFLIEKPEFPFDLKVETSDIEEVYLINEDARWSEDKIKKRGQNNSYTYQRKYRSKPNANGDYTQEVRKPLTSLQYVVLREEKADPKFSIINRQRYAFVYKELPYSIDVYNNIYGQQKTYILRFANNSGLDPKLLLPEFLQVIDNVNKNPKYSLRNIALIQA